MNHLRIRPLPLLKIKTPKAINTYLYDTTKIIDNYSYSWYIEDGKEQILVDVSCPAEVMSERGFPAETIQTPFEALEMMGTSPDEIDKVIVTHLHIDHIGFGYLYKNAKFIVQKAELETAFNPHPIQRSSYRDRTVFENLNFEVVEGDSEIADGLRVLFTPGHTAGTQSVMVETEKGKVVIAGMCSIRENFEPPEAITRFMPVIATGIHLDARQSFDSLLRVKDEADIVIPPHDPEFANLNTIP